MKTGFPLNDGPPWPDPLIVAITVGSFMAGADRRAKYQGCCTEVEMSPLSRNRSVTFESGVYQTEWKTYLCRLTNGFVWMRCIGLNGTR